MNALLLTLKGSIRSWGCCSIGDNRSTELFPTASGVLGLAGACMGVNSSNSKQVTAWYKGFYVCSLSALSYKYKIVAETEKVLYPTVFTDYQTISKSRNMANKRRKETIVSLRHYLSDALDVVAIIPAHEKAEDWLLQLAFAVQQPCFTPYLGRRCNSLSAPLAEPGERVVVAETIDDISELLFKRLTPLGIGNWSPHHCELRIPTALDSEMSLDKKWCFKSKENTQDQRENSLRFFRDRQIHRYRRESKF